MSSYKPLLSVDFDGVIHAYTSGWEGPDIIRDEAVPGAMEFLEEATEHMIVAIFSARSNQPGGLEAMQDWLKERLAEDIYELIQWPLEKPPARVAIDDRCILFEGEWPEIETLLEFKPWNKR